MRELNLLSVLITISFVAACAPNDVASTSLHNTTTSESKQNIINIYAPVEYEYIYAWTNDISSKSVTGDIPGDRLQDYNDSWKKYTFNGYESLNFSFNRGLSGKKTPKLNVTSPGTYWYYDGEIYNEEPDTTKLLLSVTSWEEFNLWEEYPSDYWTLNSKYEGSRHDFREETIYYTTVTRFYDGDVTNNINCWGITNSNDDPAWRGDFKGLIEKMDYIKALGFTTIWITPIIDNASGFDFEGNNPFDMNKIDSRFNSEDVDFQKVIEEAHNRDMKICLDVILNHTGTYGENYLMPLLYKDGNLSSEESLKANENSPLPYNYSSLSSEEQTEVRINMMTNKDADGVDSEYVYHHLNKNIVANTFDEQIGNVSNNFIDLNTENPIVAEYLIRSYGNFIKMGVDAFNISNMKNISRLTINKYLVPSLYEFAKKCGNENFFIFGEVSNNSNEILNSNIPALSAPFYTWKEDKEYLWGDVNVNLKSIEQAYNDNSTLNNENISNNAILNGLTYSAQDDSKSNGLGVVDSSIKYNYDNALQAFDIAINGDQYYHNATNNILQIDSPSGNARIDISTQARAENLNLMFTFRGIPSIYYGNEIEFKKGMPLQVDENSILVNTGKAYYGDYLEGEVTASDFGKYSASGIINETLNGPLAKHIMKLNLIRRTIPALSKGQYTVDESYVSTSGIGFIKRYTENGVDSLALIAISDGATFKNVPNGKYIDAITGDVQNVTSGRLTSSNIGKGNMRIYVCCASGFQGISGAIGATGQTYLK